MNSYKKMNGTGKKELTASMLKQSKTQIYNESTQKKEMMQVEQEVASKRKTVDMH